jgi:hypothetical protein
MPCTVESSQVGDVWATPLIVLAPLPSASRYAKWLPTPEE